MVGNNWQASLFKKNSQKQEKDNINTLSLKSKLQTDNKT